MPTIDTSSTVRSECPLASRAAAKGEFPPPTSITLSDVPIPTRSNIRNDHTASDWNQLRVVSPCPYTWSQCSAVSVAVSIGPSSSDQPVKQISELAGPGEER